MAGSTGPETYFRQEEDWLTQINMQPDELDQHHRQKLWNWSCECWMLQALSGSVRQEIQLEPRCVVVLHALSNFAKGQVGTVLW